VSLSRLAPVAVFAYNRPRHLRRTLTSLMACDGFVDSPLTIFCDGARNANQIEAVAAVRDTARQLLGGSADIRIADANRGLAQSIIEGVGELTCRYGRVIVVEDDLDLAPCFLTYMAEALDRYAAEPHVFQVSGHMFDVPEFNGRESALFLPMTTTWGWGTWDRAWAAFDRQAAGWEQIITDRALRRRFNLDGAYDYATMLERQMAGRSDSWGIRWYWSVFRRAGLTLFPPQPLVRNTGHDGSGTHGAGRALRRFSPSEALGWPKGLRLLEGEPAVEPEAWRMVRKAIWRQNGGWTGCAADFARRLAGQLIG